MNYNILGILSCRIFEDELLYLIEKDKEIKKIILLNNGEAQKTFEKRLQKLNKSYKYCNNIEELNIIDNEDFTLFIDLFELKLDSTPKILREKVYDEVDKINKKTPVKNLLLLYGLCGNVLGNIETDFSSHDFNIKILTEENGDIVDDCIGATLGGRNNYLKLLKSFNGIGTLILTPMGTLTTKEVYIECQMGTGMSFEEAIELTKMTFEYSNYKQVAFLKTGLRYIPCKKIKKEINMFSKTFDLKIINIDGGIQTIFERNYFDIKSRIKK